MIDSAASPPAAHHRPHSPGPPRRLWSAAHTHHRHQARHADHGRQAHPEPRLPHQPTPPVTTPRVTTPPSRPPRVTTPRVKTPRSGSGPSTPARPAGPPASPCGRAARSGKPPAPAPTAPHQCRPSQPVSRHCTDSAGKASAYGTAPVFQSTTVHPSGSRYTASMRPRTEMPSNSASNGTSTSCGVRLPGAGQEGLLQAFQVGVRCRVSVACAWELVDVQ